jgi:hypothetical protein
MIDVYHLPAIYSLCVRSQDFGAQRGDNSGNPKKQTSIPLSDPE